MNREIIRAAIAEHGTIQAAAAALGCHPRTLQRHMAAARVRPGRRSKIDPETAAAVRHLLQRGHAVRPVAALFGVGRQTVQDLRSYATHYRIG